MYLLYLGKEYEALIKQGGVLVARTADVGHQTNAQGAATVAGNSSPSASNHPEQREGGMPRLDISHF
jgi:hypothetical protein